MTQKIEKGALNRRFLSLEKGQINEKTRTIEIPFSSEEPVETWWGTEVLSHEESAPNLERINNSGSLLFGHDYNQLIGVIERVWLSGKRLYARLRFSESDEGEKRWKQVLEGVLRNVSFGYSVEQYREEKGISIGTRWTVYEISMVSVPADPTVGLGRSLGFESQNSGDKFMTEVKQKYSVGDEAQSERERCGEIMQIADYMDMRDLGVRAVSEGWTVQEMKARSFDEKRSRLRSEGGHRPIANNVWNSMSRRETQQFSISKAIAAAISNNWSDAGLEREVSQSLEKVAHRTRGGVHIPLQALSTRSIQKAGDGSNLIEESIYEQGFIDILRNRSLVQTLGSTPLVGLEGDLAIPRTTTSTVSGWVGESEQLPATSMAFDQIKLTPKSLGAIARYSRLMILQSSPSVEDLLRRDLAATVAQEVDRAALFGTGTDEQPRGIANTPGIGSVAIGTNGGPITWEHVLALESSLTTQNADIGRLAYLTSPQVRGVLKQTLKNPAGTDATWIWEGIDPDSAQAMMVEGAGTYGMINNYLAASTSQIPSNLTKGSGTGLSALLFGNFSDLLIGQWGNLEILVNPYESDAFSRGDILVRVFMTIDIALRHGESFAICRDVET